MSSPPVISGLRSAWRGTCLVCVIQAFAQPMKALLLLCYLIAQPRFVLSDKWQGKV